MLSLCMIAKNEEKNIARAINSVKPISDEIVVVDTGSTDRTKEAAKELGAKTYDFRWRHDFSAARNYALGKCNGDWIFVLDADEIVSSGDLAKFKELVKKKNVAYRFIQRTYSNEPAKFKWNRNDYSYAESRDFLGWRYRGIIRLFRKGPQFVYPVHETAKPAVQGLGWKIVNSEIPIHHFPVGLNKKSEYYYQLLKNKVQLFPNANSFAEIAILCHELGMVHEALFYKQKALNLNEKISSLVQIV